eukprot:UN12092
MFALGIFMLGVVFNVFMHQNQQQVYRNIHRYQTLDLCKCYSMATNFEKNPVCLGSPGCPV